MNKVALLTGPSGNLGPIWQETLEDLGYEVMSLDLPETDIGNDQEVIKFAKIKCEQGMIPSIIVHNAGVDAPPGAKADFWSDGDRILSVNLKGAAKVTECFLNPMIDNGGGVMTFIGSMLGFVASDYRNYPDGFDKPWAYGASKIGLWKFIKDCNVRWARKGIIFNMLALSGVDGKQSDEFKAKYIQKIPIERMLKKDDFINEFKCCVQAKVPYDFPLFVGGGYTLW